MINISDEKLLAYSDGELDAAGRAEVEAAMRADPALAHKVEQQRSLRQMLSAAYDPVLEEPMPARLLAAAQAKPAAAATQVVDLGAARAERDATRAARAGWGWAQWGGMAACLMIGLFIGRDIGRPELHADATVRDGKLFANGALHQLLTTASAADAIGSAPTRVGMSFVSKGGDYCRTFSWSDGAGGDSTAGLACRNGPAASTGSGHAWELRTLARNTGDAQSSGPMRQAASGLPPEILHAVESEIAGTPLDAQAEQAALKSGWRKP